MKVEMKKVFPVLIVMILVSGCGSSESETGYRTSKVSENPIIQRAYESCVSATRKELKSDNPDTPDDIMKFMYEGVDQTCNSSVVITCNNNVESQSCKLILDMYRG
jgi:hypothetical protein